MKLTDELQKKLNKLYEPSSLVQTEFRGNDIVFKTDEKGNPVILFFGKMDTNGKIKGNRYTRV
jgi:hypothetical protein